MSSSWCKGVAVINHILADKQGVENYNADRQWRDSASTLCIMGESEGLDNYHNRFGQIIEKRNRKIRDSDLRLKPRELVCMYKDGLHARWSELKRVLNREMNRQLAMNDTRLRDNRLYYHNELLEAGKEDGVELNQNFGDYVESSYPMQ